MTSETIFVPKDHGFLFKINEDTFDFFPTVEDNDFQLKYKKPISYETMHREDGITLRNKTHCLIFKLISIEENGVKLEVKIF